MRLPAWSGPVQVWRGLFGHGAPCGPSRRFSQGINTLRLAGFPIILHLSFSLPFPPLALSLAPSAICASLPGSPSPIALSQPYTRQFAGDRLHIDPWPSILSSSHLPIFVLLTCPVRPKAPSHSLLSLLISPHCCCSSAQTEDGSISG